MADLEKSEKNEDFKLSMAEEEIKLNPSVDIHTSPNIDVKDRDPNNINEHVKVNINFLKCFLLNVNPFLNNCMVQILNSAFISAHIVT